MSTTEPKTAYTTTGSVRGTCGHRHRTIAAAEKCRQQDADACAQQGGYSDRRIIRADGAAIVEAIAAKQRKRN